jgi:hypothetical protein
VLDVVLHEGATIGGYTANVPDAIESKAELVNSECRVGMAGNVEYQYPGSSTASSALSRQCCRVRWLHEHWSDVRT